MVDVTSMVRFAFLLLASVLLAISLSASSPQASHAGETLCAPEHLRSETCPAQANVSGPEVDLTAGYEANSGSASGGTAGHGSTVGGAAAMCANGDPMTVEVQWSLCGTGQYQLFAEHSEWTIAAPNSATAAP